MRTRKMLTSILLVFFVLGFCSVVVQTTLLREFLVVFSGNELCLGILFAVWFLWIGVGAAIGSWLSHFTKRPGLLFAALTIAGTFTPFAQIYCIRLVRAIYDAQMGVYISFPDMLKFALPCLAPFGLMIGVTFPLGCRVFARQGGGEGIGIGWVYVVESLGFLTGGVVFTFILVTHGRYSAFLNATLGFGLVALACFVCDLGCFGKKARIGGVVGTIVAVAVLLALDGRLDRESVLKRWQSLKLNLELKKSVDSRYENIAVGYAEGQYTVFGSGSPMFAFPDPYNYAPLANYVLAQHPDPKSVLVIGNATQGLLREMLACRDIESLRHVEFDPMMTEVIKPYLPKEDLEALRDPRLRRAHGDGRFFIKTTKEKYDLVFVNIPDPTTAMINRYYTHDFYNEVKAVLNENGVVAITMSTAANYIGEDVGDYAGSIFRTFRDVFPYMVVSPGEHNFLFGALKPGIVTDNKEELKRRFKSRTVKTKYFTEYHFELLFPQPRTEIWRKQLEERAGVKRNTDLQPISYFYNLILWDRFSGSHLRGLFRWVEKLKLRDVALALLLFVALRLLYTLAIRRNVVASVKFNALLSMLVVGFSSMVIDLTLIFGFQNLYGYVYHMIGLISALFMFGLAIGGVSTNVVLRRREAGLKALFGVHIALVAYALFLPVFMRMLSSGALSRVGIGTSQLFFLSLIVLAGIICGVEFPLASGVFFQHSKRTGVTAGLVDGADHLGACVGAALSGTVLVPIIGLLRSCYVVALVSVACMILIGVSILRERRRCRS